MQCVSMCSIYAAHDLDDASTSETALVTRIQIAKPDIIKAFEALPHVLRPADVARVLQTNRTFWRLAQSTSFKSFTEFLCEKTAMKQVQLPFPQRPITGYVWGDVPLLEVVLELVYNSHLSHYTAVRIHGLTEQVPKTVFVSHEKKSNSSVYSTHKDLFDQSAIDAAFQRPPRASNNEVTLDDVRIVLLQNAYHANLGITAGPVNYGGDRDLRLRYTNLERTLIDIVVRPFYAGGVSEVAKAFENAKGKLSVNALASMVKRMEFGYPYHQAIGYYLARAGYKPSLVDLFSKMPMERDFYLTHEMGKTAYVKAWRLHVPEGF